MRSATRILVLSALLAGLFGAARTRPACNVPRVVNFTGSVLPAVIPGSGGQRKEDPKASGLSLPPRTVQKSLDRLKAKGYRIDLSAYEGLPPELEQADLRYFFAAAEMTGGKCVATRTEYRLLNNDNDPPPKENREAYKKWLDYTSDGYAWGAFPDCAVVEDLGPAPLPVKLLPAPERLEAFLRHMTPEERARSGLPDISSPFEKFVQEGRPYARGLYFEAGLLSFDGNHGCPMPHDSYKPGGAYPNAPFYLPPADLGKLVGRDEQLEKPIRQIRLGKWLGAKLLGRLSVLGITEKVYLVEFEKPGKKPRRYIAYPIADANGAARSNRPWIDPEKGGRFENSVRSPLYDPRLGRHSLLKVPRPFLPSKGRFQKGRFQEERIAVGPGFAKQVPPVVVLRKDTTWKPFMEDYVLDNRLSFFGDNGNTARLVCVFTNIEPADLLRLIGALQDRDVSALLKNEKALKKLEALRIIDARPEEPAARGR